ncbi:MAG: hypothetical protein E7575_01155 [Ruminococcaceae bacterium]|nr:hypothetical protein [Oscillospiraceae bacterium]
MEFKSNFPYFSTKKVLLSRESSKIIDVVLMEIFNILKHTAVVMSGMDRHKNSMLFFIKKEINP